MMFSWKIPAGLSRCADPSKILVPIATPSSESNRRASETEPLRNAYIISADAEYPVCLPYTGMESEPYYGTFPVLFLEIFRVLFSVFIRIYFRNFSGKDSGNLSGMFFRKSSENSAGIVSRKTVSDDSEVDDGIRR